ncbi:hypothetical protein ZOSMA_320G00080 [Zostera marina]|uniref:Uncharacterized protein n=1 Tax=Zostera marina TaxID=29655 RepID=A0A0K9P8U8_ZOSMR|nr:hypothetical protein ZOSMA_320G00080 [Zostera marina]
MRWSPTNPTVFPISNSTLIQWYQRNLSSFVIGSKTGTIFPNSPSVCA